MGAFAVRPIVEDDLEFLHEMAYEAAFWRAQPPAARPPLERVAALPEFAVYVRDWGRAGDRGLVAWEDAERRGAAWFRLFDDAAHGHGYVDDRTPELGIGVVRTHRGQGIGSVLLRALLVQAAIDGHRRVSLSVEIDNPARRLYERLGFTPVARTAASWTMVARTARGPADGAVGQPDGRHAVDDVT